MGKQGGEAGRCKGALPGEQPVQETDALDQTKGVQRWASSAHRAGFPTDRLPPVLVGVFELQKRGALHAHLALGYTTDAERVFARAFIDSLKKWGPLCGLGFADGWRHAEKKSLYSHERAASYLCKYLTKDHPPCFLRTLKGPVVTVSHQVIAESMCTMALLRKTRRLWSARDGRCDYPSWDWKTALKVGYLLDARTTAAQGP